MAFSDQPLYRARAFEPVAGLNDIVCLTDAAGPIRKGGGPFFQVVGIEPVPGLGSHGVLLLYTQGATAPAGYQLCNNAVLNQNIGIGASVTISGSTSFQQGPKQVFQARFALKILALTGVVAHDIDLQVYQPAAVGRFGTLNISPGYFNAADQFQDPADAALMPAQNALEALPAVFPAVHQRDEANMSEFFIWEINGPAFKIINNGVAAVSGGSIGLRMWGYRFDLTPVSRDSSWQQRLIMGSVRPAPAGKITFIPTAPFASTSSYSPS